MPDSLVRRPQPGALGEGARIGVVGAGALGSALISRLVGAKFEVHVYDPSDGALQKAVSEGAKAAASAEAVVSVSAAVIVCVSTVGALSATIQAALQAYAAGTPAGTIIETSTLPVAAKEAELLRMKAAGAVLLDCPVSGTSAQARAGDLVLFASGDTDALARCALIFAAVARRVFHLGRFGAGMRMKLLANHLVALNSLAAAEMLMLAEASGLDAAEVVEALSESAGSSRMLQLRGPLMARRDFAPTGTIDTIVKDGAMILEFAAEAGCDLPLFSAAHRMYSEAQQYGLGASDIAAIITHFEREFRRSRPSDAQQAP